MKYSLILQSFGKEGEYRRALFCLYSLFRFENPNLDKVILFTDKPDFFTIYFNDHPVQYILLTEEKVRLMRGEIDFLHRMKIAMIEEVLQFTNENILYVDSDTFFLKSPEEFMTSISPEISGMHKTEYPIKELKDMPLPSGSPFLAFYNLIQRNEFSVSDGFNSKISPELYSWNAGTIALHSSHVKLIKDVYSLTDQFYPKTQNHACEQYAFSIILQTKTQLLPMQDIILHYWYRVKKKVVDKLLFENLNENFLIGNFEHKIRTINTLIQLLPKHLTSHVWILRDNAIQAFNNNNFGNAYSCAVHAIIKDPFDVEFYMSLGYHIKRHLRILLGYRHEGVN